MNLHLPSEEENKGNVRRVPGESVQPIYDEGGRRFPDIEGRIHASKFDKDGGHCEKGTNDQQTSGDVSRVTRDRNQRPNGIQGETNEERREANQRRRCCLELFCNVHGTLPM